MVLSAKMPGKPEICLQKFTACSANLVEKRELGRDPLGRQFARFRASLSQPTQYAVPLSGRPVVLAFPAVPRGRDLESWFVRRVSVVGVSGSGKSTLARELAARLGVPHVELDAIFHQPGWQPLPAQQFAQRVSAAVAGDGWVIDGNYSAVQQLIWYRADTVIWLDLPRHTVMQRIVRRTLRRVATGEELWNGNRERWRNLLTWDPEESVISWSWHHYGTYRDRYAAAMQDPVYRHLDFIRITKPDQLRGLTAGSSQ